MAKQSTAKKKQENKFIKWLKTFFKGLISNQTAIDGAKEYKWYIALSIGLASVILAIVPIFSNAARSKGSSIISSASYGFEQSIVEVTKQLKTENKKFVINDDKELIYYIDDTEAANSNLSEYADYEVCNYIKTADDAYALRVFYSSDDYSNKTAQRTIKGLKAYLANELYNEYALAYPVSESITSNLVVKNDIAESDRSNYSYYSPSYLILYKDGFYLNLKKSGTTTTAATMSYLADWKHFTPGTDILNDAVNTVADEGTQAFYTEVLKNWKTYLNKGYLTQKYFSIWFSPLIYFGVYVALLALLGLLLFLMTRGKKNVFNYLNFSQTLKMSAWLSFSPAILALIMGFILSNFASIFFIMLVGVRTMWAAVRQLRPTY